MRQVLIVDDDGPSREVFRHILRGAGYETLEASDGLQALELLSRSQPDLVLLDMHLPIISGGDLLTFIYAQPHLQLTRVIVATAHGGLAGELVLREGDHYLVKPIPVRTLRGALQELASPAACSGA